MKVSKTVFWIPFFGVISFSFALYIYLSHPDHFLGHLVQKFKDQVYILYFNVQIFYLIVFKRFKRIVGIGYILVLLVASIENTILAHR